MAISLPLVIVAIVSLAAVLYEPLALRIKVLGLSRSWSKIENVHGEDLRLIPDTVYSEDLHYHAPSNLLFVASEGTDEFRWKWFPPMEVFKDPKALGRGSIVVIDPKTLSSKRLSLINFPGQFNTHGIDVWSPDDDPRSIYIFAINHLPNPEYFEPNSTHVPKARSQIEIFHYVAGTSEARHLRSIRHPLIRTPNDILIRNARSIYVTNDHYYREGYMKLIEDVAYQNLAPWTDLIHLEISNLNAKNATASITGTIAKKGIHNNNGLGRGKDDTEILIGRTCAGVLVLARPNPHPYLEVVESIQLPCTIDNPSYFRDPYAKETGRDASGYVLAGLARAATFPDGMDPVMVWLVQSDANDKHEESVGGENRTQRLLFQDDGKTIRSASTAVLIAIDPKENEGKKQAWLFVTGPISQAVVASKVDL